MPQVSLRPAHAPRQPPAASLSEPHSCPPAVPAATGQLSRSRMRPPAVAARTVCGLGGWCVRRGPRGPKLPPRAALRKVRGSRDSSNPAPNEPSPGAAAAHSRAFRTSQVPLRGSRRSPAARARRPTSPASPPPPAARPPTSPRGARSPPARRAAARIATARAHARPEPLPRRAAAAATPPKPRACVARDSPSPARLAPAGIGADAPPPLRPGGRPRERAVHAWCVPVRSRCVKMFGDFARFNLLGTSRDMSLLVSGCTKSPAVRWYIIKPQKQPPPESPHEIGETGESA